MALVFVNVLLEHLSKTFVLYTVRILIKFYIYPKGQPEERKDLLTNLYFTWKKCKRILDGFFL